MKNKLICTGVLLLALLLLPVNLANAGVDPDIPESEISSTTASSANLTANDAKSANSTGVTDPDTGADDYDDTAIYTLVDEQGNVIAIIASRVFVGDEYISGDNKLYRVVSVDDGTRTAIVQYIGTETDEGLIEETLPTIATDAKKLIAIYCTHSDESYIPSDGTESKEKNAGIYDVSKSFAESLEALGIEVIVDDSTHLPHDAGAYRRSRVTATRLMEQQPAALIDIHRDGIPDPDQYVEEIDGEAATKVRLLVGRSNPNADENRAFARKIKKVADEMYPDLIKDIFIGKGNYNQELMPRAILLEFGTHTISKERAIASTEFMANVMSKTLFGTTAKAEAAPEPNAETAETTETATEEAIIAESEGGMPGWGKGLLWTLGAIIVVVIVYGVASTGSFKGMWDKVKSGSREVGGGLFGKHKDSDDDK